MRNAITRRSFLALGGSAVVAVAGLGLVGCGGSSSSSDSSSSDSSSTKQISGSVTAAGSTALQPLVEAAAEQFQDVQPGITVSVQGGGSGQGITQIVQGTVQIGDSDVFAEEKVKDSSDLQKIKDNKVCVVGMGPVVNPDLGITNISMDNLKGIFLGQITNWKDAGGPDQEIVVINRASGSGTRATFESNVLKGEKAPDSFKPQEQDSSGTVASMVAQTPGSISYLAFSYYNDSLTALSVDNVEPKEENVESGDWKIWAYEHMYTAADPDEATQAFVDYMLGDDVQGSLIESNGYIPMSGMKVERDADGNETTK
ncbi:MAG: phosphate ABC transporter substrate-binding protein PstS family protein [Coriobacteriales bacterium]|nr:phosphate ABC transporter substrate-binding protein PstS family protein [Coriobacteriales bacterium]